MRDGADNAVIVCSIENVDPMGIHTGDSVTVAPQQTLTDREYQAMRDDAIACIRAIGVDTGGSNVQFAVDPRTGRRVVIEMNPRVSRSSALASKATGFPIAKIAALLAVGYRLDEIANDITGETPAAFEPTLDYVVVKIPRFDFEKFPGADPRLGTVDEVRRRGDGDRPHLQGGAGQGVAFDGAPGPGPRSRSARGRCGGAGRRRRAPAAADRASARPRGPRRAGGGRDRDRPVVPRSDRRDRRGRRGSARCLPGGSERPCAAPRQAGRALRRADRGRGRGGAVGRARPPRGARRRAGLQDRRHVRRGVRRANAVPLLDLRAGDGGYVPRPARGW